MSHLNDDTNNSATCHKKAYRQAGLWVLAGALFFSVMNAIAKGVALLEGDAIPPLELTFARYVMAVLVLLPFVLAKPARLKTQHTGRYIIRTLAGFGGIALMFVAIQHIPLAAATAIGFTSPIFSMFFAALLLREKIGSWRWLAAVIGLSGAFIIASPGGDSVSVGSLIAILAAVFMGAEIVGVKWLSQTRDRSLTILFYSNLAGAVISFAAAIPFWVWPTAPQFYLLVAIGTVAVIGQICILKSARLADAHFLAPFFYVSLIYSATIGFFIFNEAVTATILSGCAAILISAVIMMRSQQKISPALTTNESS